MLICVIIMVFSQSILCRVISKCPISIVNSKHICIHICTWPNVNMLSNLLDLDVHTLLALSFIFIVYGFCQCYIYYKFKIVPLFLIQTFVRTDFEISFYTVNHFRFTLFSMCVWRMLPLARESCDSC